MKKIVNKIFLFVLCTAILFSSFGIYKVEGKPVQATYSPWTVAGSDHAKRMKVFCVPIPKLSIFFNPLTSQTTVSNISRASTQN